MRYADFTPYDLVLLAQGLGVTVGLFTLTTLVGLLIAALFILVDYYRVPVLRQVIVTISEALKNSPVLVQLFLVFFGLPAFFQINMTPFVAASLTISLNTAAFAFVIFRSGIDAVDAEQVAAAKVYGHSRWQILRFVLFPQAAAFSIGPLVGLLVNQLQVTSLISVIGVFDLTKIGNILNLRTLEPFDRQGFFGALILDETYADLREEWAPSYSGIVGNRWDTDKGEFGIIVSASSSELKSDIHGWQQAAPSPRVVPADWDGMNIAGQGLPTPAEGYQYRNFFETCNNCDEDLTNQPIDGTLYPASRIAAVVPGWQMRTNEFDRERNSFYTALQWQNDTLRATLKYVYVDNATDALEHTTEAFANYGFNTQWEYQLLDVDTSFSSPGTPICGPEAPAENRAACEPLIPIGAGLMQAGLATSDIDGWFGAYGLPVGNLGIGKHDTAQTDDISLNVKWNATDRLFVEFDAHKTT
ncbi:ABC transporter permease subunit, partial [uncultured Nitratireductor sp.]|uniref:amino acid ABC transporter permease n=1 Tax=uncultured Nitratireductor sp. TaxID=520953 RepID=UPI0025E67C63